MFRSTRCQSLVHAYFLSVRSSSLLISHPEAVRFETKYCGVDVADELQRVFRSIGELVHVDAIGSRRMCGS
jgi:hypothetical protein